MPRKWLGNTQCQEEYGDVKFHCINNICYQNGLFPSQSKCKAT